MNNKKLKIIYMAERKGQVTVADVKACGISESYLTMLARGGTFRRIGRGVYVLSEQISENETLLAVNAVVPQGVICLLSALQFHEITTQMPIEVWVAIERNSAIPKQQNLPLRVMRMQHRYYTCGIEEHKIQGVPVKVYSPAKTVVDCFRFRNKTGLDVAIEALKDSLLQGKATMDEIYKYAKECRMLNVMRPYMEATQ